MYLYFLQCDFELCYHLSSFDRRSLVLNKVNIMFSTFILQLFMVIRQVGCCELDYYLEIFINFVNFGKLFDGVDLLERNSHLFLLGLGMDSLQLLILDVMVIMVVVILDI